MPQQLAIGAADASGQLVHGLRASHERMLPAPDQIGPSDSECVNSTLYIVQARLAKKTIR